MSRIWVDADACPVVIKDIIVRAALRTGCEVGFVANQPPTGGVANVRTHLDLPVSIDLAGLASDPEGKRTFLVLDAVSHGTVTLGADGLTATFAPAEGGRYYLVVPAHDGVEGSCGNDSSGTQRPPSPVSCMAVVDPTSCP